jgi:hypothetical protein
MEWTVVSALAVLVGLATAITGPLVRLNGNIAKLTAVVDGFKLAMETLRDENRRDHERFYSTLNRHETALENHDCRIRRMEEQ